MSIVTTFDFDNPANFTLVNAAVNSGTGKLGFIPKPSQLFNQSFDASAGFTFNAANTEFAATLMRQIDLRPADAVFHANFNTNKDGNWGNGTLAGTLSGGAAVTGGLLDCKGDTLKSVDWDADNFTTATQLGAVRLIYKPNYSGNPATSRAIISLGQNAGGINLIRLNQLNNGTFQLIINSSSGAGITVASFTAFTFVAGVEYELELNWDINTGAQRLFIDGTQQGATGVGTGTRSTAIDSLKIGGAHAAAVTSDAEFDDVIAFDAVQHTANYTPGVAIPATIYGADTIDLPSFSYPGVGTIQSLDILAVVETGVPHYTFEGQYFDGADWVASDGSYAQSNTLADVNTNFAALDVSGETTISVQVVWLASNTQSSVDTMVLTYTGQDYSLFGTLLTNSAFVAATVTGFTADEITPANTSIRYIFNVNGQDRWLDGSTPADSNGTAAESNTLAEIQALLPLSALAPNAALKIKTLLITTDQQVTPEIDTISIVYDFGAAEPANPQQAQVFGFVKDAQNNPIVGAIVNVEPNRDTVEYIEAASRIIHGVQKATTDDTGFWSMNLIVSSDYEVAVGSDPMTYKLSIDIPEALETGPVTETATQDILFTVPDGLEFNITDLIGAA